VAGKGWIAVTISGLVGGLAAVGPLVVIVFSVAILAMVAMIVIVVWSDKMSTNFERILAILLGRDMPSRGDGGGGGPGPRASPPSGNGDGSPTPKRWPRRLGRRRNGSGPSH